MAALVTGGAGFIGSHVAEALVARGDEVVVLDDLSTGKRENVPDGAELVEGDIREPQVELFARVKPEVCFHLAAQIDVRVSVARPDHDAQINVLGTVNVLQAAREHGTKIVFSSTGGAIYGECERPGARGRAAAADLAVRRRRSSPARSTSRPTTVSTGRGTSRCGTATSTGRGRTRTARRGSSRSSSTGCASGEAPTDLRRREPDARLRLRRRRRARDARGRGAGRRRLQRRHRPGDLGLELLELCQRVAGTSSSRSSRRPGRASSSGASSTRAARSTSSAGGPSAASRTACARPGSDLGARKERGAPRRITFGPWRSRPPLPAARPSLAHRDARRQRGRRLRARAAADRRGRAALEAARPRTRRRRR